MDQFLRRTVPAPPNIILTVINDGNGGLTVELGQDQPEILLLIPVGRGIMPIIPLYLVM